MRVLLTGFGPFPGVEQNPTAAVVHALAAEPAPPGLQWAAEVLPVSWQHGEDALREALSSHRPAIALHLGVATAADRLRVERCAVAAAPPRPDALGTLPERPPPAARVGFDTEAVAAALCDDGLPAEASEDAGAYLCNAVLGWSLVRSVEFGHRAAFLHVPMPGTARPDGGAWTESDLRRAARRVVEFLAAVGAATSSRP
ncbi:MAG: hypothetical protein H6747_09365 [Deltaproteobacteria bacterium]|nr:hypothetical protein [Deltaproteobacteria bacterium]